MSETETGNEILDLVELVDQLDEHPRLRHLSAEAKDEIRQTVASYRAAWETGSPHDIAEAIHDIERCGRRLLGGDATADERDRQRVMATVEENHANLRVVLATEEGRRALAHLAGDED